MSTDAKKPPPPKPSSVPFSLGLRKVPGSHNYVLVRVQGGKETDLTGPELKHLCVAKAMQLLERSG